MKDEDGKLKVAEPDSTIEDSTHLQLHAEVSIEYSTHLQLHAEVCIEVQK